MWCTNCGNELKEGQLFCTKCGTRAVEDKNPTRDVIKDATKTTEDVARKKKKTVIEITLVVCILLLIICVVAGLLFKISNSDSDKENEEENSIVLDEDSETETDEDEGLAKETEESTKKSTEENAEQVIRKGVEEFDRFLNNEEAVFYEGKAYYLNEIENLVYNKYELENYGDMAVIEGRNYGFIDCGLDGVEELILEFSGDTTYVGTIQVVIRRSGDKLVWVEDFNSVYRTYEYIDYAGCIYYGGSGGATCGSFSMDYLDANGVVSTVYGGNYHFDLTQWDVEYYPEIKPAYEAYYGDGNQYLYGCLNVYAIDEERYYLFEPEEDNLTWVEYMEQYGAEISVSEEVDRHIFNKLESIVGNKTLAERIMSCEKTIEWKEIVFESNT